MGTHRASVLAGVSFRPRWCSWAEWRCQAVGTSLIVIAKSFAAFAGYAAHVQIDLELAGGVTAAAVVGTLVGARFAAHVPAQTLRKGFAWFVLMMAAFVLSQEAGTGPALVLTVPAGAWMGWMSRRR